MNPFKYARHYHDHEIIQISNVIQRDDMGYPLRLCITRCKGCGMIDQRWIDTDERDGDVELIWKDRQM